MDLKLVLAENVKHYRKEAGLSQEDLAFDTGLHRTYISSIERGKRNVSIENVAKIADALHKMPYQLLYYQVEGEK
ncbi:helix-turn-helix domain-containing protein [Streptococcus infantis]|nr:helix-turn-helix domain-containing protein [Streptococcus infantis]